MQLIKKVTAIIRHTERKKSECEKELMEIVAYRNASKKLKIV